MGSGLSRFPAQRRELRWCAPVTARAHTVAAASWSGWKALAEHRQARHGFGLRRLVLEDVPVLGELAVLDADDVSGDPRRQAAVAGEATVSDDEIALGYDQLVFVAQRRRRRSDQVEQALAAWRDMGAVLDVACGPEPLGGGVVC